MKFGNPIASPAVPFINGQYDSLGSQGVNTGAAGVIYYFIAQNSYSALLVQAYGGNVAVPVACSAANNTQAADTGLGSGSGYFTWSSEFPRWTGSAAGPAPQVVMLPFYCVPGDVIAVTVVFNAIPTAGPQSYITVWGLTDTMPPPFRADGRVHPQGIHVVSQQINNTTANLVVAPPSPLRIMLKTLYAAISGSAQCLITVVKTGVSQPIFVGSASSTGVVYEWESGMLIDVGQNITISSQGTAATIFGSAIYDLTL